MHTTPLGDVPVEKFLSEYWQKKPLLIRNAIKDIQLSINAEVLAGLACEEAIESRFITYNAKWDVTHGPFNESFFAELPEQWTLLVQAVDHWLLEASKFLQQFNFIPRWRIDDLMISCASDGGGVGPHFDHYDVFLVQTSGQRKWEIGQACNDDTPVVEDSPISILQNFKAQECWVLEPGDLLYVPAGVAHNGVAQGADCITCSVGFRAPSHSDVLREFTDHVCQQLPESLRYKDPELNAQTASGEISANTIDALQNILRKYTEDKELIHDWFGHYITTQKYSNDTDSIAIESSSDSFSKEDIEKYLSSNKVLFRNESSRFAFQHRNKYLYLYVDGECVDNSPDSDTNKINCIKALCENIEFSNASFPPTEDNFNLLARLLSSGALYLDAE